VTKVHWRRACDDALYKLTTFTFFCLFTVILQGPSEQVKGLKALYCTPFSLFGGSTGVDRVERMVVVIRFR